MLHNLVFSTGPSGQCRLMHNIAIKEHEVITMITIHFVFLYAMVCTLCRRVLHPIYQWGVIQYLKELVINEVV